ncbi:hypothetical protein PtB15_4B115 [Puccinia triticina]|nr:hypothetical protein PtB15_4B115 [Puccinia triticina]
MDLLGILVHKFDNDFVISSFSTPATDAYTVQLQPRANGAPARLTITLVVEDPVQFLGAVTLPSEPKPDTRTWVLNGLVRREFSQGDSSGAGSWGAPDDRPAKKSRPNDPYTLQDNRAPTQAADDNKPLWTAEDFARFLAEPLAKKPRSCPPLPTPPPANGLSLTEDEVRRHLENLAASVSLALKGANDILKFVKNQRQITAKSSPEWMWWFKEACEGILGQVLHGCPNAPTPRKVEFPGISVVQCLPRDEVDSLTAQLQKAGIKALVTAQGLMAHKDHKYTILANINTGAMEMLQIDCWGMFGSVENMCPGLVVRKQRR